MRNLCMGNLCSSLFYLLVFSLPFIGYAPLNVYGGLQISYILGIVLLFVLVTSNIMACKRTVTITSTSKILLSWFFIAVVSSLFLSLKVPQEYLDYYPQEQAVLKSLKTIVRLAVVMSVYLVSVHMMRKRDVFKKAMRFLVYGGLFAGAYGLYQMFAYIYNLPGANLFCNNISYGGDGYSLIYWGHVGNIKMARIASTAYEPSFLANFLLLVIPVYFILILNRQKVLKTRRRDIVAITVMALAFVLTYSRGGWLALLLGCFCFGVYLMKTRKAALLKKLLSRFLLGLAVLCCVATFAGIDVKEIVVSRFGFLKNAVKGELSGGEDYSFDHRITSYGVAANIILKYPLFGVGLGNYGFYYQDNIPEWGSDYLTRKEFAGVWSNPKGVYMNILTDTGIVGFAIFSLFVVATMRSNSRFIKSSDDNYAKAVGDGLRFSFFAFMFHGLVVSFLYFSHAWFLLAAMAAQKSPPGKPENI